MNSLKILSKHALYLEHIYLTQTPNSPRLCSTKQLPKRPSSAPPLTTLFLLCLLQEVCLDKSALALSLHFPCVNSLQEFLCLICLP